MLKAANDNEPPLLLVQAPAQVAGVEGEEEEGEEDKGEKTAVS